MSKLYPVWITVANVDKYIFPVRNYKESFAFKTLNV